MASFYFTIGSSKFIGTPVGLTMKGSIQFNEAIVKQNWKRFNKAPLAKAGMLVRRRMRQSIRHRKNRGIVSKPGQPPYSHDPRKRFKMIYSIVDQSRTYVVVGHRSFDTTRPKTPMAIHEFGLRAVVKVPAKRRRRKAWTKKQARAARRLYVAGRIKNEKKKRLRKKMVKFKKRPFAWPAYVAVRPRIQEQWRGAFHEGVVQR